MTKYLFLTLIPLFSFGCAKSNQSFNSKLYLQYVGDDLSDDFKQKISIAIEKINQEAGGTVLSLSEDSEHQRPLTIFSGSSNEILGHAEVIDFQCIILLNQNNLIVNNNSDPDQTDLSYVILHELGHCYKRKHSTDTQSIMFPSYGGSGGMNYSQFNNLISRMGSFAADLLRNPY